MLKNYTTLAEAIEKNHFILSTVSISGQHIMARHLNDKTYICHLKEDLSGWAIDNCKSYANKDKAIKIMITFMKKEISIEKESFFKKGDTMEDMLKIHNEGKRG